jgi:uncharacterized protein
MKYLLLLLIVGVVLWVWRVRSSGRVASRGAAKQAPEGMLACAHCGLHLPASEALLGEGAAYCSDAHRAAGPQRR